MPDSSGVRFPLRWLQRLQHATRLSHADSPPRERGNTWSNVNSEGGYCLPQYWQVEWSRSKMFLRDSDRLSNGIWMYSVNRMTAGAWIVSLSEWSMCPLCSSTRATPLKIITTARRSVHTLMGSKEAFSTRTRPVIQGRYYATPSEGVKKEAVRRLRRTDVSRELFNISPSLAEFPREKLLQAGKDSNQSKCS